MTNIDELKSALLEGIVTVKFNKVNGDVREMSCTLKSSNFPGWKGTENHKKKSSDIMSVWCIEVNAWRSFRTDSIISWRVG